jgi:hypothetical protein
VPEEVFGADLVGDAPDDAGACRQTQAGATKADRQRQTDRQTDSNISQHIVTINERDNILLTM